VQKNVPIILGRFFVFTRLKLMNNTTKFQKISILLFFILITAASAFLGTKLYKNSLKAKHYKKDFFKVNQMKYGLFNGENWTWQLENIIEKQIDSFSFSPQNKKVMHEQISIMMNKLLTQIDDILHTKQEKFSDNVKYKVFNSLVDIDDFRDDVPRLANTLIAELDKCKNKEKVKGLLKEKVGSILSSGDVFVVPDREVFYKAYGVKNLGEFNNMIKKNTAEIEAEQKQLGYILIGLMALTLFAWIYIIRSKALELYSPSFMFSVLISFVNLFIGISLPMIEIDARIGHLDLELLSSHIVFYDQIIFFQSKSILDVVLTLIENGKADTVFVGVLILAFSILFPVGKLISATCYLFMKNKKNRFIKFMAFKSGKWSMADVMVVAIFMAYVGFQGILNDQLANINVSEEKVNLLSTNRSNLQVGFLIFVAFCLFNLILSSILKRITTEPEQLTPAEPANDGKTPPSAPVPMEKL